MAAKYTKLILIVCLLLGILGCMISANPNSTPVRSLRITIDVNQREEFFTQLRKFADKHSLKFTLTFYDADKKNFLVAIYGEGFHISSAARSELSREIDIDFFNEASTPTPQETVDEIFNDLKSFLGEIPNVTITELP